MVSCRTYCGYTEKASAEAMKSGMIVVKKTARTDKTNNLSNKRNISDIQQRRETLLTDIKNEAILIQNAFPGTSTFS